MAAGQQAGERQRDLLVLAENDAAERLAGRPQDATFRSGGRVQGFQIAWAPHGLVLAWLKRILGDFMVAQAWRICTATPARV